MNINNMQQQLRNLQLQLNKISEYKQKSYEGEIRPVTLSIRTKTFNTTTKVLFNEALGSTLFLQKYRGDIFPDEELATEGDFKEDDNYNRDLDQPLITTKSAKKINQFKEFKVKKALHSDVISEETNIVLYFDRKPEVFVHIFSYLNGYPIQYELKEMDIPELKYLRVDCEYFNLKELASLVLGEIESRFDPYLRSPLVVISGFGGTLKRAANSVNLYQTCPVMNPIFEGKRYTEFNIISHGNRHIMIGVTEAEPFYMAYYAGHAKVPGCSLYGNNGQLYRSASSESWGAAWNYGDKIGVYVDISKQQNRGTATFYLNRQIVRSALNLVTYLDMSKGVRIVVSLYSADDQVAIVANAVKPQ